MFDKFTQWVRSSFEGNNKTASSRRITTFWFVALESVVSLAIVASCLFLVLTEESRPQGLDSVYKLIIFSIVSRVSIFLLMSIITWQNITDTVNAVKGQGVFTSTTTKETKEVSKQVGTKEEVVTEHLVDEEVQEGS